MIRKIIKINEEKCNGCGACASACHEGAIEMIAGKARLTREHYCDGLGDCLPACPVNAISFEEREAPAYDGAAVLASKQQKKAQPLPCGCPSMQAKEMKRTDCAPAADFALPSCLTQWPVQIKLVSAFAPFFRNSDLLIAADCTAYAYGSFHQDFIRDRITLIGCPKLDEGDYTDKFTEILKYNSINSITVVRMEVPCCGGIERAVKKALQLSEKSIPLKVVIISTDGKQLS